ncbi:aminodeoxychorismate synthase component I [bacterium]|nr:MAG: aminodeoxychorismate synthase component I [bacterium]
MPNKYYGLPKISASYIEKQEYFLLFESALCDKDNFKSYIFSQPIEVIKIKNSLQIEDAFKKIQVYSKKYYLAGYFAYELGYSFEKIFSPAAAHRCGYPLIYLCVFDKAVCFDHRTNRFNLRKPGILSKEEDRGDFAVRNLRLNLKKQEYIDKIGQIKRYIKSGDTYQVNFTAKYHFDFSGSAFSFYRDLKSRQSVYYSAFCKFKDDFVISLSPELYFVRKGSDIYCRPMKGTIARGVIGTEDRQMACRLKKSIKDLSENIMIVDLMRNDLGRISRTGSVRADNLFNIEKYNTLFQMTSGVKGILKKGITYLDIFKNIFPGGSVTGAPKIRTMQIIRELERESRNIYCGALGVIFPRNKAVFNMPIRTILLRKNKGEMGIGSGIVYDSSPEKEYQECLLKAKFLTQRDKPFQLIETMLWQGRYVFLKEHLRRLRGSAEYFGFNFDPLKVRRQLAKRENSFKKGKRYKIRLLLDKDGGIKIEDQEIFERNLPEEKYIAISRYKTDPQDRFLYHKTSQRLLYDSEYQYYYRRGCYDVVFLNTRGEVAEGAISNIVIRKGKDYFTPLVSSGILPGIYRAYLMKKLGVKEKVLLLKDLYAADKIFLCNSVRGLTEVRIK